MVQAPDTLSTLRLADAGGQRGVHVPIALAPDTDAVGVVVAVGTLVAVGASVANFALVTCWGSFTGLDLAGAGRCHGGAGAALAAVGAPVETTPAELAVLPLRVALAVQAAAC